MATHSSFLPGKPYGQRGLVGYSPWGCTESDTTERLSKGSCLPGRAARCVRRVVPQLRSAGAKKGAEEMLQEGSLQRHKLGLWP